MAANINSFASLRVPAWHGLGTVIDKPVGAFEFQEIAGLNWSVSDSEIFTSGMVQIEGKKAIIRNDTGKPKGRNRRAHEGATRGKRLVSL